MTSYDAPRIYVGTYAKYNNGSIKGAWLDLLDYDDKDDFYEACRELHSDEADPELMFQDWEGLGRFGSECSVDWDFVDGLREAQDDSDERAAAYVVWAEWSGETDYSSFEDAYCGQHDSEAAFTEELVQDTIFDSDTPEMLMQYFDYDSYQRDLFMGGFYFDSGFVFRTY